MHQTHSRLAADGFALVVVCAGRPADAAAAVEVVTAQGGRAIAFRAGIADEQAVSAVFDRAEQEVGGSAWWSTRRARGVPSA